MLLFYINTQIYRQKRRQQHKINPCNNHLHLSPMVDQIHKMMCDQEPMAEIMPNVITTMASLLQRVSETNDDLSRPFREHQRISAFSALTKPSISIRSYMERIFKYANCSDSCYIVAYIYLDRFIQKQPFLPIDSFNVHRLIITSVLVSAKFMDDL